VNQQNPHNRIPTPVPTGWDNDSIVIERLVKEQGLSHNQAKDSLRIIRQHEQNEKIKESRKERDFQKGY
jgi:hypothetical protein